MCTRAIHDGEDGDDVVDTRIRNRWKRTVVVAAWLALSTLLPRKHVQTGMCLHVLCRVRSTPLHTLLGVTQHEHCLRSSILQIGSVDVMQRIRVQEI